MNQEMVVEDDGLPEEPVCQHHWKIAPPNGATSIGKCKVCGEEREFRNSSADSIWDNDSGESGFNRGRGRNAHEATVEEDSSGPRRPAIGTLLGRRFTPEEPPA
jgi:hypothetical protein